MLPFQSKSLPTCEDHWEACIDHQEVMCAEALYRSHIVLPLVQPAWPLRISRSIPSRVSCLPRFIFLLPPCDTLPAARGVLIAIEVMGCGWCGTCLWAGSIDVRCPGVWAMHWSCVDLTEGATGLRYHAFHPHGKLKHICIKSGLFWCRIVGRS